MASRKEKAAKSPGESQTSITVSDEIKSLIHQIESLWENVSSLAQRELKRLKEGKD